MTHPPGPPARWRVAHLPSVRRIRAWGWACLALMMSAVILDGTARVKALQRALTPSPTVRVLPPAPGDCRCVPDCCCKARR